MATTTAEVPLWLRPAERIGAVALSIISYLGGLGLLLARLTRAVPRSREALVDCWRDLFGQLRWMCGMGIPLAVLSHIGLGSFLSMQAYYGGTFVEGTGAVVGVGLFRNVAPMVAGLVFAGLLGARMTSDIARERREVDSEANEDSSMDRRHAMRIVAAGITGPLLGFWGALTGLIIGWRVGESLLGVSTHSYFTMFWDMLWYRDLVGLLGKGVIFGVAAAAFAVHEGSRRGPDATPDDVANAAFRAVCLGVMAVLLVNSSWFVFFYHAGPALGPTLLTPPNG